MKKAGLELKVGIFVIAAVAILVTLVFKAGDFYFKPGYTVRFIFDFVSGVTKGSPVRLAGVDVGEVKDIRVVRNAEGRTEAEVYAWIAQGTFIEEDAEVRINSLGLLGERYIEILPGSAGVKTLAAGGTLFGKKPLVFDTLAESGNRLIGKMEFAMDNINEVVTDPGFKTSVRNTFANADKVTSNLIDTTDDLKDAVKSARIVLGRLRDGEGTIGHLLKDDTMAKNLDAFSEDIKAHPWKLLKKG
ncbi:MAG: MCE family protein [Candidatus Omnitrophica bacterium]|nr:MCE family protein [Candidatus Omnitrophota bacterium]